MKSNTDLASALRQCLPSSLPLVSSPFIITLQSGLKGRGVQAGNYQLDGMEIIHCPSAQASIKSKLWVGEISRCSLFSCSLLWQAQAQVSTAAELWAAPAQVWLEQTAAPHGDFSWLVSFYFSAKISSSHHRKKISHSVSGKETIWGSQHVLQHSCAKSRSGNQNDYLMDGKK